MRLEPHRSSRGSCSACRKPAPGYDRLPQRSWLFVPLWGIKTYFFYTPRRVDCPVHGVVVEHIPWAKTLSPLEDRHMRRQKLIRRSRERFAATRTDIEEKLNRWIKT